MKLYWHKSTLYEVLVDNLDLSLKSIEKGFVIPGKLLKDVRTGKRVAVSDKEFDDYFPFDENLNIESLKDIRATFPEDMSQEDSNEWSRAMSTASKNYTRSYMKEWVKIFRGIEKDSDVPEYLTETLSHFCYMILFDIYVLGREKRK